MTGVWGEQQIYWLSRDWVLLSIAWGRGIDSSLSLDRTRCYKYDASSEVRTISAIEQKIGDRKQSTVLLLCFVSLSILVFSFNFLVFGGGGGLNVENLIPSPLDISSISPLFLPFVFVLQGNRSVYLLTPDADVLNNVLIVQTHFLKSARLIVCVAYVTARGES